MLSENLKLPQSREFTPQQKSQLKQEILAAAFDPQVEKKWAHVALEHRSEVEAFVESAVERISHLEGLTQPHQPVDPDHRTDVVYLDTGPGLYSYDEQQFPDRPEELRDLGYHGKEYTRKMDRRRLRWAASIVSQITAQRLYQATGVRKTPAELLSTDFARFGPYLHYASMLDQNQKASYFFDKLREAHQFRIPHSKIIMYHDFVDETGTTKEIIHTEDQMQGLRFTDARGKAFIPKEVLLVSQPAHIMRLLHILGLYREAVPQETTLRLFPVPTPDKGVMAYAKDECLGTLATILSKQRASFTPFSRYSV